MCPVFGEIARSFFVMPGCETPARLHSRLSVVASAGPWLDRGRCPGCALLFTTVSYAMLQIENFHGTEVVLVTATNVNT